MGVVKHPCILLHALLTITFIPLGYNSQWRDKVRKNWARSLHNQNMKQKPWKISQQFFSALCTMSFQVVSSLFWVIWTSFQQLLQKPAQVSKTNTDIDTHHYETLIKKWMCASFNLVDTLAKRLPVLRCGISKLAATQTSTEPMKRDLNTYT